MVHNRNVRQGASVAAVLLSLASTGCIDTTAATPVAGLIQSPDRQPNGAPAPRRTVVPVTLDNNRMFAAATFRLPGGGERKVLAWVNMGMGGLTVRNTLGDAIGAGPTQLDIGGMPLAVQPKARFRAGPIAMGQNFGPMPVDAILPEEGFAQLRLTLDYQNRAIILERPSDAPAPGIAVPIEINPQTGLVAMRARIDGRGYLIVLDSGGGYSWMQGHVVRGWLRRHPDWRRAEGAPGQSNQAMVPFGFEQRATVARIPLIEAGALQLHDVGVLGSSPAHGSPLDWVMDREFWHAWGKAAPAPPLGWLGGNALRDYRVTFDYRNRMSYWLKVSDPKADDLDSVGISLAYGRSGYGVGGLVRRDGKTSVEGVRVGDVLVAVDGRPARPMTRGEVITALHGAPGDHRRLTLDRKGQVFEVEAVVTAY